jgi:hypothetical protein
MDATCEICGWTVIGAKSLFGFICEKCKEENQSEKEEPLTASELEYYLRIRSLPGGASEEGGRRASDMIDRMRALKKALEPKEEK